MSHRRLILSAWLLGAGALSLILTVQHFRYGDEWWHIALGREILTHGIPSREPFSFIPTQHKWVEQQWLYEIVLAKLVSIGGAGLASLVMGVLASAALLVAALSVPPASGVGGGWRATALLIGALVAAPALGVRGEVISVFGIAVTLLVLQRWRAGKPALLWLLPPLFLLWANGHSGFIAGLAVLGFTLIIHVPARRQAPAPAFAATVIATAGLAGLTAGLLTGAVVLVLLWGLFRPVPLPAGTSRRRLIAFTGLAALATLINPAGPGIYAYVADTFSNPLLSQLVSEWQSPNFHDTFTRLIVLLAGTLLLTWVLSARARIEDVLLAAGAFLATLQAVRNVALFAVIAIPQLAEYGAAAWAARLPHHRLRARMSPGVALAAAALVAAGSLAVTRSSISPAAAVDFERTRLPSAAADYVATHLRGERLLSTDLDGGYLAYRFPHGRIVFVYDEIGLFGRQPLTDYLDLVRLHGDWRSLLAHFQFRHAVLPAESAAASALLELGWTAECYDGASDRVVLSQSRATVSAPPPPPSAAPRCG